MRKLRCWLGHDTTTVVGETLALSGCRRCGYVESVWRVLRPEHAIAAERAHEADQRQHEAVIRDRERRAQAKPARLLRIR